jgi:hypothetical protein
LQEATSVTYDLQRDDLRSKHPRRSPDFEPQFPERDA